jgi:hypothetical protein
MATQRSDFQDIKLALPNPLTALEDPLRDGFGARLQPFICFGVRRSSSRAAIFRRMIVHPSPANSARAF